MAILKELWTGESIDDETKSSYGYMVELRKRLDDTCQIAQEQLKKAKMTQKTYYDKKTRRRQLTVGDRVLLLLPSDTNKLILTWKGPSPVLERRNDVDYVIDLGTRTSLFHINMLKKTKRGLSLIRHLNEIRSHSMMKMLRKKTSRVQHCNKTKPIETRKYQGSWLPINEHKFPDS